MVSVIIPVYNFGHLIAETIASLLAQTYKDIEIIVINDGSTDNTVYVVSEMIKGDHRISLHSYKNAGLGESRNRGLRLAKGEFIQFLDADDLLEDKKLEMQTRIFESDSAIDIVYGSVRYFVKDAYDEKERLYSYWGNHSEWMPGLSGRGHVFLSRALTANFAHLSSFLFRKSSISDVGNFNNDISAVADYDFLLRCVIADKYFYYQNLSGSFSLVRWHSDNMSKNATYMRKEEIRMRQLLRGQLQENSTAKQSNEIAIKALSLQVTGSWKKIFLSGGPFDFLKKGLEKAGFKTVLQKIFYK